MALHTPVGTLLAYSTANPWWCPVVFRPSHIYSLGRLFLLMTPSTSQLHFIQPSCCSATTQPVREETDAGSGKWPGGYSWAACLLSPWPPSLSVPAGKACHLRGRGPPWTNWGFVISPCYWGLHALLDKSCFITKHIARLENFLYWNLYLGCLENWNNYNFRLQHSHFFVCVLLLLFF